MTHTTAPTLLRGVDLHGGRVRVRKQFPAPYGRVIELYDTADDANARALELERRRKAGLAPTDAVGDPLLKDAAAALLTYKQTTVSRKTKRRLRKRGVEWWQRILRPWMEGEHADLPLSLLNRHRIDTDVRARAVEYAKTAADELYGLKATLRHAGRTGARFDLGLLELEPIAVERRKRLALTVPELDLLATCAPAYGHRMLLFKGTVGCRIDELFTLTDDRVDLAEAAIFIPAELCKEGVDKWIDLTREEVQLLREQMMAKAPGSTHTFPTKTGLTCHGRYGDWHRMVWSKACRRAAAAWRLQHGFGELVPTPFDDLEPHDLRATAATLMRDAGFTREDAAARLGHADSGKLLDRIYDQGDRRARMRRAIAEHAPQGLRAETAPRRPTQRDAATGPASRERS